MHGMIEVRWHGRAGQGVVTASQLLAEVMAREGKHVQAFPHFGAEKRGAPIEAYTRISEREIRVHSEIEKPDMVIVADPTLIGEVPIAEGTDGNTYFLFNAPFEPSRIREKLGISSSKVYSVDATSISLDEIGRDIPNIPILAAFFKTSGMMDVERFREVIKELLSKRFNEKIVEANLRTIDRAIKEVKGL